MGKETIAIHVWYVSITRSKWSEIFGSRLAFSPALVSPIYKILFFGSKLIAVICMKYIINTAQNDQSIILMTLHKRWSFPLRISSVNVTKFAGTHGFRHIYWRNPPWKTSFFEQCDSKYNCLVTITASSYYHII